ncbi:DUF2782 domain-containing protein [Chiayiivirga flava]|uniref:DUF2782 domain-containing protein n=1 Tax=Chiayiivirga flava TaxID=659595 RepID=A0A7W8D6A3_9GAMM|nr:DUF2782 domain-containing protein [Chiayiivirga flava]MBB5207570.1 hypothetical protein [Chiayiivirga flava]
MHKILPLLSCLLLAGACAAQAAEPAPVPPPPPIDRDAPPREAAAAPPDGTLPDKIVLPPSDEAAPQVTIRSEDNGDTVEEYRINGQITMVKVRPKRGIPYTMMDTNGDGRLDRSDSNAPVGPVYYTIYEWD